MPSSRVVHFAGIELPSPFLRSSAPADYHARYEVTEGYAGAEA